MKSWTSPEERSIPKMIPISVEDCVHYNQLSYEVSLLHVLSHLLNIP
jgi:hypothetical protein